MTDRTHAEHTASDPPVTGRPHGPDVGDAPPADHASVSGRHWSDRINPIVVKELRQASRGRFLAGVLLLVLVCQLFNLGIQLVGQGVDAIHVAGGNSRIGRSVAAGSLAILAIASVFFVPLYAGVRIYLERAADGMDLLFVTTLPPHAMVRGKLVANLVLLFLLVCASAPFLSFTYLLRGVDPITILLLLGLIVASGALAVQCTLVVASLGKSVRVLAALAWLGMLGFGSMFTTAIVVELVDQPMASQLLTTEFLGGVGAIVGIMVAIGSLAYLVAAALLSPPVVNRALPVRRYLSILWPVSLVALLVPLELSPMLFDEFIRLWVHFWILLIGLALLVAVSAPTRIGPRVAAEIPRDRLARWRAYFLFSGAGSGIAWCLVAMASTLVATFVLSTTYTMPSNTMTTFGGVAGFFVAYPLTAFFLRRRFLARRTAQHHTWLVTLFLATLASVGPFLVAVLSRPSLSQVDPGPWLLLNPWAPLDHEWGSVAAVVGTAWAVLSIMVVTPYLKRSAARFRPPGVSATAPLETTGASVSDQPVEETAGHA